MNTHLVTVTSLVETVSWLGGFIPLLSIYRVRKTERWREGEKEREKVVHRVYGCLTLISETAVLDKERKKERPREKDSINHYSLLSSFNSCFTTMTFLSARFTWKANFNFFTHVYSFSFSVSQTTKSIQWKWSIVSMKFSFHHVCILCYLFPAWALVAGSNKLLFGFMFVLAVPSSNY